MSLRPPIFMICTAPFGHGLSTSVTAEGSRNLCYSSHPLLQDHSVVGETPHPIPKASLSTTPWTHTHLYLTSYSSTYADSPPSPQLDRVPPLLSPETLTSTTSWRLSSQLHRCRIHLASSDGQFSKVKFPRIPGTLVGGERQVIKKLNVLFIQKTSVYFLLKTIIC